MYRTFLLLIFLATVIRPAGLYAEDSAKARKLINSQGCKACHSLAGDGGTLSVSFEAMREKLSKPEIRAKLVNREKQHGNMKIRDFSHLDDDEINTLVEFIQPQP